MSTLKTTVRIDGTWDGKVVPFSEIHKTAGIWLVDEESHGDTYNHLRFVIGEKREHDASQLRLLVSNRDNYVAPIVDTFWGAMDFRRLEGAEINIQFKS